MNPRIGLAFHRENALSGFVAAGGDLELMLLGSSGQEAPHTVCLPPRDANDLGQSRSLGPPDQLQDTGALALRPRRLARRGSPRFSRLRAGLAARGAVAGAGTGPRT